MKREKYDISMIIFINDSHAFSGGERDFVANMPKHIVGEEELMLAIGKTLQFPDYYFMYGVNWNIVDEALGNLSWLKKEQVILKHEDLPVVQNLNVLGLYLQCLLDAKRYCPRSTVQELLIVFPAESRATISYILQRLNQWGWVEGYNLLDKGESV